MGTAALKNCTLWGDMSSDRASEQYPEAPVCVDCIAYQETLGEDSIIVSVGSDVTDPDAECVLCDGEA